MFIISVEYLVPVEEVDKYRKKHIALLNQYYEMDKVVAWGRKQNPVNGGFIFTHNMTREEVNAFITQDPYATNGLANHIVFETEFSKAAAGFTGLLE